MTKVAVVIVHNKTDAENQAQIVALNNLLEPQFISVPELDEQGNQIGTSQQFSHYTVKNLTQIEHQVFVYQIVPYQPTNTSNPYEAIKPANISLLRSHNVYYGKNDVDKVGVHPRFFNWGLKRSTDYGADVIIYLQEPESLTTTRVRNALGRLTNDTELIEESWGKIVTKKLFGVVGQLREDFSFDGAVADLKNRMVLKGLRNG